MTNWLETQAICAAKLSREQTLSSKTSSDSLSALIKGLFGQVKTCQA